MLNKGVMVRAGRFGPSRKKRLSGDWQLRVMGFGMRLCSGRRCLRAGCAYNFVLVAGVTTVAGFLAQKEKLEVSKSAIFS
jgi:hypothetical protein